MLFPNLSVSSSGSSAVVWNLGNLWLASQLPAASLHFEAATHMPEVCPTEATLVSCSFKMGSMHIYIIFVLVTELLLGGARSCLHFKQK